MASKLEEYIKNGENDLIREYLQNIFWNASKGNYIRKEDFPYADLECLIESDNDKIRKWAYYVTCFYSNKKILETLKKNIFEEKNELIRSWMFATAYKTRSNSDLYEELLKKDIGLSSNTISLIEDLFQNGNNNTNIDKGFIKEVIHNDSMIDKSWLTFNYKYKPDIIGKNFKNVIPMEYISDLTKLSNISDSNENLFQVEEYALSALSYYSPRFSFSKCVKFKIDDITKRNSDPRKWAYTLFWKDLKFVNDHFDFARDIISSKRLKIKDREGIAKGLFDHYIYNKELERYIIDWYMREDDVLCQKHLKRYMSKYKNNSTEFRNQVEETTTNTESLSSSYTIIQNGTGNIVQVGNNNNVESLKKSFYTQKLQLIINKLYLPFRNLNGGQNFQCKFDIRKLFKKL